MRFADLRAGGRELAEALARYASGADVLVLGIVRGGVPAATEVAPRLAASIDLVLIRRLPLHAGPHAPLCAVSPAGTTTVDGEIFTRRAGDQETDVFIREVLAGFAARVRLCRGELDVVPLRGRTVILADNGVHTGGTLKIAIRAARALHPAQIVAAVPVASSSAGEELEAQPDEVVCLSWAVALGNVARTYADFRVPHIEAIRSLTREASTRVDLS